MLYKIDKYIIRAFVPSFLLCMLAICGIYIVVDTLLRLDDFIELGPKAFLFVSYYYAFMVPVILAQLFPAITLISVSMVLIRFAKNNEILAMQVAGINLYRVLLPIFVLSVIMSFSAVANQELIIPRYAKKLKEVELSTFKDEERENVLVEDKENHMLLRAWSYNIAENKLKSVFVVGRNEKGRKKFTINADEGKWEDDNKLLLINVVKHNYDERGKWIAPAKKLNVYFLETTLTPEQLSKVEINPTLKSFKELNDLCNKEPENPRYSVMFHTRVAYPLTNFVLLFLGVPFVIGFERMSRNVFIRVGIIVLICGSFYVLSYVCASLGNMDILHPILAAWLPTALFGFSGLFLFDWMHI